jgi:hypothetical protein
LEKDKDLGFGKEKKMPKVGPAREKYGFKIKIQLNLTTSIDGQTVRVN